MNCVFYKNTRKHIQQPKKILFFCFLLPSIMVDVDLELRSPADNSVELGYLYDVRRGMESFTEGLPSSFCSARKEIEQIMPFQNLEKNITTCSASRMLTFLGEKEITAAHVRSTPSTGYGKSHYDLRNSEDKEYVHLSFSNYTIIERQTIDISSIGPESFEGVNYDNFTHIVTDVYIGKILYGDIKIKSRSASQDLMAGEELKTKDTAMTIPIGGSGSLTFNTSAFDMYEFSVDLVANGLESRSYENLSSFLEIIRDFETNDASLSKVIVKVVMKPLSALRQFATRPLSTSTVVKDTKTVILNLIDLVQYFNEQLLPFLYYSTDRIDIQMDATELKKSAVDMLKDIQQKLSEYNRTIFVSEYNMTISATEQNVTEQTLNDLCSSAENYTVDNWIQLPLAVRVNEFLVSLIYNNNDVCLLYIKMGLR